MSENQGKNSTPSASSRVREVNRLNRLEKTLWPAVEAGNAQAMDKVLDIIDRRCRLLNLYAPQKVAFTDITGTVERKVTIARAKVPFNRQGNGSDAD